MDLAENDLLTQIGPGTRMGNLLRRYWHPIGAVDELKDRYTKKVKLLGEDLVLFRDRQGRLGLIEETCPHRRASLAYGIPTQNGLRCPYHGWEFDQRGQCIDQPNEPEGSGFKSKVKNAGYVVEELGGLVWAYLGPDPVPLVPRIDGIVAEGTIRTLGYSIIPCNWLQIMENSLDVVHTEWTHGQLYNFTREKEGVQVAQSKHQVKYGWDETDYGIIKRRVVEGNTEEHDDWKIGHPIFFPLTLASSNDQDSWREYRFQFRVPMDDTHTFHYFYSGYAPPPGKTPRRELIDRVHVYEVPYQDANGNYKLDETHAQDIMVWITQGAIAQRHLEKLGSTDRGMTMYRRMLMRELARMEAGEDPMNTFRDPARNRVIELPCERTKSSRAEGFRSIFMRNYMRYMPIADEVIALYSGDKAKGQAAE